ncbi:hypothetical protein C475_06060 [Halosimplex carlsbadense 2-9-1]|uniref:Uncharacterized protein n=1 Tax=Halosimplex carlsbadense 2-9-1 TaxID=797114 RepID=M0CW81_9EURY|nr:hypothetical protein [Halosimplex carlsbadense]ELZ27460.1 hypothetical protein C475_06060 [Halosimplex carlsbadense 2-9-1]
MDRSNGRERLASVGGTLLGYGLLGLGIAMAGLTAYQLLFAAGRTLETPVSVGPQAGVGLALGVAGYLLLGRTLDADADPDEPDVRPSESRAADAYQFDT